MMDTLFGTLNVNSWSIYKNKSGTTICTIRFKDTEDCDTIQNYVTTPISYKRKSVSQQLRDRSRMERFIRPYTRSQSKPVDDNIERFRDDNNDDSSDTGPISPDIVPPPCLDTSATLLSLVDSPDNNTVHSSEASDLLSPE